VRVAKRGTRIGGGNNLTEARLTVERRASCSLPIFPPLVFNTGPCLISPPVIASSGKNPTDTWSIRPCGSSIFIVVRSP
jgi:hypothetical protein